MSIIYSILILTIIATCLLAYGIFYGLKNIKCKKLSVFLTTLESLGYIVLLISLIFGFVTNIVTDGASKAEFYKINKKLDILWYHEREKIDFNNNEKIDNLYDSYKGKNDSWNSVDKNNKELMMQKDEVQNIQYILYVLSTIFISLGRGKELFLKNKT